MSNSLPGGTLEQLLSGWSAARFSELWPDLDMGGVSLDVVPTAEESFGDYQCNAAMAVAKRVKCAPRDVARKFVEGAQPPSFIERIDIAGPGFLNFWLKTDALASRMEQLQRDERLGTPAIGEGRTVVVDYGGPNIAKPLHVAHIRSTVIGNSLDRLHRFLGYRVIADNHLGDWGTQFGILIMGYRHFVDQAALAAHPMDELLRIYVASSARAKEDEAWQESARGELVKLQQGDPENRALWRQFVDLSLRELDRLFQRLDVRFDLVRGESWYNDRLPGVIDQLRAAGLAEESEGALIVRLEDEKLPPCIVRKSDGGYNYATTDLATVQSRVAEFQPSSILYVTDVAQINHFAQLFAVCRRMGIATPLQHVWFGRIQGMSTREGNVIKLEVLLDKAREEALRLVKVTSPEMSEAQQQEVAEVVGLGAVKYADLSQNRQTNIVFSWEKALAMDGNSAPYLQYTYARIASVRDKYRERFADRRPEETPIALVEPIERRLALRLARFPDVVLRAVSSLKPNLLCDYLFDLAQVYSTFYQNVPFLKAEDGVRESRVRLCDVTARTLKQGLSLLGIGTLERI